MRKTAAFLVPSSSEWFTKVPWKVDQFQFFKQMLEKHGFDLVQAAWTDASMDWKQYSLILPLQCIDYPLYPDQFKLFLNKVKNFSIRMINDVDIILWNMCKTYLIDLKNLKLNTPNLILIPKKSPLDLSKISQFSTSTFVAKPSIGLGALGTVRFEGHEIARFENQFKEILQSSDLIIEPFFPEIAVSGEYSFVFFNSRFSHAVLKKPMQGDFRAHPLYGATISPYTPLPEEIEQASQFVAAVKAIKSECHYARVDLFRKEGKLCLMELELIEPYLFLEYAPPAAVEAFCASIIP
jgi:hypothetical protein